MKLPACDDRECGNKCFKCFSSIGYERHAYVSGKTYHYTPACAGSVLNGTHEDHDVDGTVTLVGYTSTRQIPIGGQLVTEVDQQLRMPGAL